MKRRYSYAIGVLLSIGLIMWFMSPQSDRMKMPENVMKGHEKLSCTACHEKAEGTMRQQIQSNLMYWLGSETVRKVPFRYETPGNDDCLACHNRKKDHHPVYRFREPKYKKVRERIHPEYCVSCHREHQKGASISIEADYCKHCHKDLSLKHDPLDVSHKTLIVQKQWDTCLRCHDFHGNHDFKVPETRDAMIAEKRLKAYLYQETNQTNPYGKIITKAKEKRDEN